MKMRQQLSCLMSFVAEIRLNAKEGTHKTFVRMRCSEIITVPMCVIETKSPLGSLTDVDKMAVIVVNKETQSTI
jgi:phosphoribosyl-dephospho-CoA transferase